MTRTTFRLKGAALKRCLHRVVSARSDVSDSESDGIAADLARVLASADVRRIAWSHFARRRQPISFTAKPEVAKTEPARPKAKRPEAAKPEPPRRPRRMPGKKPPGQSRSHTSPAEPAHQPSDAMFVSAPPSPDFDPYAFGLVPVYQREGGEALRNKLATIRNVDHLRRMARAQQIGLPASMRRGEVAADSVRDAIIKAVEKRIADRRAAAS